jgi:hypothetical protein
MTTPGQDRIFIAAKLVAPAARLVRLALAVMIASGGAPGITQAIAGAGRGPSNPRRRRAEQEALG